MSARPVSSILLLCWRDTGHPQGGGSEAYVQRIGAQWAKEGIDVTLRTARYPGAARDEVVDGVRISRGGGPYSVYIWAGLAMVAARIGLGPLRRVRPDVVIDTQNGLPFLARLAFGKRVAVLVHHCHRELWPVAGPVMGRVGWFVESRLSPRLHRRNQYVTVSLPSARDLNELGVDSGRIAVVRNGLDQAPAETLELARSQTRVSWCFRAWCRTNRSRTHWKPLPPCATRYPICIWTSSAAAGGSSGWSTMPNCWASPTW